MNIRSLLAENLIRLFDDYCKRTGRGQTVVSRRVARDSRFLETIRDDVNFTIGKYDITVANFREIWPADLRWPIHDADSAVATIEKSEEDTRWQTKATKPAA